MMKKININCPIGKTGYGITSWNICKQLHLMDVEVSLFPIGNNIELNGEEEKPIVQKMFANAELFDPSAPCLKVWHQYDLANRIGGGDYYSFPFFELDTFSKKEVHHMNTCDYMFTTCDWAKRILRNNDVDIPITIAPLGVDTNIFRIPNKIRLDNGKYVFAHIGKWEARKAQDFLLKAFETAFDINDNVELWLLPHNPFLKEEELQVWINLVANNKLKDKIKIYNRLPTQYHLADFIYHTDCGIFLSRAEGWNNEILEFMAMNKPIIATNYSAHTEYCNDKNSFLVDIDDIEVANDGKWFNGTGKWAKLADNELDQTVNFMRHVYSNSIMTNPDGVNSANKYSWTNTTKIIHETLLRNNSYHANSAKKTKRR
jgi:glycosyltransferase involved in cell wall biosynthesis